MVKYGMRVVSEKLRITNQKKYETENEYIQKSQQTCTTWLAQVEERQNDAILMHKQVLHGQNTQL